MTKPLDKLAMCMGKFRPALLTLAEAMISPAFRGNVDASDLVQQTFLEAHHNANKLVGIGERPIFAWLCEALRHNFLDEIKHLTAQKNDIRRTLLCSEIDESFHHIEQFFAADDTSPSQFAERNEQILLMLAAIQELPSNQRKAIILRHLRGHSLKEVADELQLSEDAVGGLLRRGRQQLVERLEKVGHARVD
jgi:RNA polymerase sigma-70 factor, ECF subfamily